MRDVSSPPPHSDDENEIERSLERGLRHQPLSPDALARVRAHVLAEFRQQTADVVRRRRKRWLMAVAATVSALAVGVLLVSSSRGAELLVDREGRIQRGAYPTYGDDWAWVESVAPSYEIENRQLAEFLAWVARETGRHITFADAHAREVANRTTLHGSVKGMRPMDALNQVLSTTSLRFDLQGGEIRIASRS